MGTAVASGSNRAIDAANRAINSPLLEDNSINGAQGILINVTGSSTLSLHEVHEASSIIQKAAHENANIIFGAVMDEAMKESVKITVIAAGFREVAGKKTHKRPSYLPKTWKAGREQTPDIVPHAANDERGAAGRAQRSATLLTKCRRTISTCRRSSAARRKRPNAAFVIVIGRNALECAFLTEDFVRSAFGRQLRCAPFKSTNNSSMKC